MALLKGRAPAQARARVPEGDRVVRWQPTPDGDAVILTDRHLVLPGAEPLPWHLVEKAVWAAPRLTVTALAVDPFAQDVPGADPPVVPAAGGVSHDVVVVEGRGAAALADEVRARVTGSIAWSAHHRLVPEGGVRIVGRRVPGFEGFRWQVVLDAGTPLDDPHVRAQALALVEAARRAVG